jgi:glycosyltransferase involved in cell wall biosynthesis
MRVLMISKALVVGAYQRKAEELARLPGVSLVVAVPPYWREGRHRLELERAYTAGYELVVLPMMLNGHYHVHFYRRLAALMDIVAPDVIHIDEEQFNVATFLTLRAAVRRGIPALFFTWQNIPQRYPPPFSLIERYTFTHAAHAIAGNTAAADIIRAKGYRGPLAVIPQFGVDPDLFAPAATRLPAPPRGRSPRVAYGHEAAPPHGAASRSTTFVIGFVGRLLARKGLFVLLEALAGLDGAWELRVVGTGEDRAEAEALTERLGIAQRVVFMGQQPSTAMPAIMHRFDVLVGPSLTTPRWKEQFGRMLVEAMACGVPVIGSTSGEIPDVIGDAGIVVPEGDSLALRTAIARLRDDARERHDLAERGRARVLALFTQQAVARRTHAVYQEVRDAYRARAVQSQVVTV